MDLLKAKKLFARPKDDPAFVARQVKIRQVLLKNLARVVKETQLLFTRTESEVIKDCRPVQRLCARFEDILRHGLKAGWFSAGKEPTFWPVVLKISRKQAIEYINRLQYAQTDSGKGRAWIRLAVNECSLESYINVLCQDTQILNNYYESHAFLRDEEVVSPFRQLLTGLTQIGFEIAVDTASLEFAPAPEVLEPALRLRAPQPVEGKKEGVAPSSPQPSSSSSSWLSSSAESSSISTSTGPPEATPTSEGGETGTRTGHNIETLRDEASGLEASYHIEDNALVIDSVVEGRGKPYSDLSRFNQALDEEDKSIEDFINDMEIEGPVKLEKENKKKVTPHEDRVKEVDWEHNVESGNVTPPIIPVLTPPIISTPPNETSMYETPPMSPSTHDGNNRSSPLNIIEELNKASQEREMMKEDEKMEGEEEEEKVEDRKKEEEEEVEYSFGDILLMVKGLSPMRDNIVKEEEVKIEEEEVEKEEEEGEKEEEREDVKEEEIGTIDVEKDKKREEVTIDKHTTTAVTEPQSIKEIIKETSPTIMTPTHQVLVATPPNPASDFTTSISSTNPFLSEDTVDKPTDPVMPIFGTNPFLDDFDPLHQAPPITAPTSRHARKPSNPFDPRSSPRGTSPRDTSPFPPPLPPSPLVPDVGNPFIEATPNTLTVADGLIVREDDDNNDNDNRDGRTRTLVAEDINESSNIFGDERERKDTLKEGEKKEEEIEDDGFTLLNSETMSLNEDYYTEELTIELVEYQIAQLKNYLRRRSDDISAQKKLVKLQLLKQEMKEMLETDTSDVKVCGHHLMMLPRRLKAKKCDTCNKPTVNPLQVVLRCTFCGYFTHSKCLSVITQKCLAVTIKELSGYTMDICPEKGLTPQHFRCACCNQALNNSTEVRLCDYSGQYYCPDCHNNDTAVIPARVLHNWDFNSRKVCCGCYKLLNALFARPLINVKSINSSLYTYVHEITTVEALRKDILLMKEFLVKCDRARTEKLMLELNPWPHFKDSSNLFSLSDLIDIQEGQLLSQLQVVHQMFLSHICNECEKCSANGVACVSCHSRDLLFPFSKEVVICPNCSSHYHRDCFMSVKSVCTVCSPAGKRKSRHSRKKN